MWAITHRYQFGWLLKKNNQVKSPSPESHVPETGSDPPIGSGRDSGRDSKQSSVVIISYMGYSPPKCTCHGKQSHPCNYMNLLECLHAQSHVPSPHRLPHTCLSQMRVKSQFSKQQIFVLENLLPSFCKILDYPPRQIAR